jgi:hypothetical protein
MVLPFPLPVAPETKLIQGTLADALHEQVSLAITCIGICREAYGTLAAQMFKETEQIGAVPV